MESRPVEAERDEAPGVKSSGGSRGAEAVAAWLARGEELEAYCARTGQSVWSLRRWRREHADQFGLPIQRRPGAKGRPARGAQASMIPIQVMGAAMPMTSATTIEVRLARERSIVVCVDIDGSALTRLVTAVEAAS